MSIRDVGRAPTEWANVTAVHPFWANAERPEYMPPWTKNQRRRPSFDMKRILEKQKSDQQQLQDYEANACVIAQPENRFQRRQIPERPELRGPMINFGFVDKILQVNELFIPYL